MTDWNALSDEAFRRQVRTFFETEYPEELRHLPHRAKFAEIRQWHEKLYAKGMVAPAWPVEYGGMGLEASKLLIFYEEQQRWGVTRHGCADGRPPYHQVWHPGAETLLAAAYPYL